MLTGILVAAVLGGCSLGAATSQRPPVDMTADKLVGSWSTPTGEVLSFRSDGGLTATDLPPSEFEDFGILPPGFDPKKDKLPGEGTWEIERPPGASTGPASRVYLHVRKLSGNPVASGTEMLAQKDGEDTVLASFIGDPDSDNRVVYRKCVPVCDQVSPSPPTAT